MTRGERGETLERIRRGEPLTEMTVVQALAEAVSFHEPELDVSTTGEPGRERLAIRRGDEYKGEASFGNLWEQLRGRSGEEAAELIEHHGSILAETGRGLQSSASGEWSSEAALMPTLQGRAFLDAARRGNTAGDGIEVAHRPLLGSSSGGIPIEAELYLCLAYDFPTHVAYADASNLPSSLPDFESAERRALANLGRYLAGMEVSVAERKLEGVLPGARDLLFYQLQLDGNYDASMVLLPSLLGNLIASPESPLEHLESVANMAVAIPNRDRLIIADARNSLACRLLSSAASIGSSSAAYGISSGVYRYSPECIPTEEHSEEIHPPITLLPIS